jgi:hypothetical protein
MQFVYVVFLSGTSQGCTGRLGYLLNEVYCIAVVRGEISQTSQTLLRLHVRCFNRRNLRKNSKLRTICHQFIHCNATDIETRSNTTRKAETLKVKHNTIPEDGCP